MNTTYTTQELKTMTDQELRSIAVNLDNDSDLISECEAILLERSHYRMSLNRQAADIMFFIVDHFEHNLFEDPTENAEYSIDILISQLTYPNYINLFELTKTELYKDEDLIDKIDYLKILKNWFRSINLSKELMLLIRSKLLEEENFVRDFYDELENQLARIEFNQIMQQQAEKYKEECSY